MVGDLNRYILVVILVVMSNRHILVVMSNRHTMQLYRLLLFFAIQNLFKYLQ